MSGRRTLRARSHSRSRSRHHEPISGESSYSEDTDPRRSREYSDSTQEDEEDGWCSDEDDDELDPSDSASVSPARHHQSTRVATRRHKVTAPPYDRFGYPDQPATSLDSSEDYYSTRAPFRPGVGANYYGSRGPQPGGYVQNQVGGYSHPYPNPHHPYSNQEVVPYGPSYNHPQHQNPFAPAHSPGGNYFNSEHRGWGGGEVMPYGGGQNFFNGYPLPQAMQQYQWSPPPPPPTEVAPPRTPAPAAAPEPPPPPPDPEKELMKQQLAEIKAEQERKAAEAKQQALEAKIREEAELAFQRKMEQMRRDEEIRAEERRQALEKAQREIEEAKKEAERATKEAIEAERRAEAERQKKQAEARAKEAEAIARAEKDAREKYEAERRAEQKAEEERKKKEAEAAAAAEAAALAKLQAAIQAEAQAKEAAAKKAAEEAEWRKRLEEEARMKAEIEARKRIEEEKAAAQKAAEEAEKRKKFEEEARIKAELEARKKVEDEKAAAAAAAAAEAAKKKEEEDLKKRLVEEAKHKAAEQMKKDQGKDKPPIRFKDAVGRKFSFPFHICQTWQGMEDLIKQAFLHVDVIGPHVQAGHYDLIGPNGEIILPTIWEKVIEPDWAVTMHMWPMEQRPPVRPGPMGRGGAPPGVMPHGARMPGQHPGAGMPGHRPGTGNGAPQQPPPPPGFPMGNIPLRPNGGDGGVGGGLPQGVNIVTANKPRKSTKKPQNTMFGFFTGKPPKTKKGKK